MAGKVAGWLQPWLDELKEMGDKRSDKEVRASLPTISDMAADLFMVTEIWRRRPLPPDTKSQDRQEVKPAGIWGSGDRRIPWYETP
jgi:hypothetical protein